MRAMEHRIVQVAPALLRIEQRLLIRGVETGTDVAGPACIFAVVQVRRGSVAYQHGTAAIRAPRRFALFLPPFGIVQASLKRCDVTSVAVAFRPLASDDFPGHPVLWPGDRAAPASRIDALEGTRTAAVRIDVGRDCDPARLAQAAKAIIDRDYGAPLEINHIAARLDVSPAVLSRTFRHAYGMPPVRYRHHVRVMDALLQLAEGAAPVQVFQDVGFDDLSRFYKIFRKVTCAPPGTYRPARSRIAKT
jgi:AraC-like DNA-binding protein